MNSITDTWGRTASQPHIFLAVVINPQRALGSSGCFLGHANTISSKAMFETCVLPTLLYGAENWILNDSHLCQLEKFQAEIGRRILHLSKHHSHQAVLVALGWPSMRARILNVKLGFLCRLLSSLFSHCSIAIETFKTLANVDVFNLSIVQQCLFLDADFGTNAVATVLNEKH